MQVTRAGEYAVIGLLYLARQAEGRTVMIDEISESEKIPKSFIAKIFQSLARSGLVISHRGAHGGFSLARPPSAITLLDIFQGVEGDFSLQKCVADEPECVVSETRLGACSLCDVFLEAQNKVNEVFSRTTLESLLQKQMKPVK